MNCLHQHFHNRLSKRRQQGNWRELKVPWQHLIDFASNDYLGFLYQGILHALVETEHQKLEQEKTRRYGATGSRLLTGHSAYYQELEEEIAAFHQAEAGLLFNSGYLANLGLLSAITCPVDTVIYDIGIHASFHDALRFNQVKALAFRHQDLDHLAKRLREAKGRVFVCVESIYSCTGTQAHLEVIHQLCEQFGAYLIVDEAHATGCIGDQGKGAVQAIGKQGEIFARLHTFSKALGGQGAIILGSSLLREYLINFSRSFIYTTALPLQSLVVIRCAYQALRTFPQCQQKLADNICFFKKKVQEMGLPFLPSNTQIQCLKIPGNQAVRQMSGWLQERGFNVCPLMSPTVRRGEECLRICLHAFNTKKEIEAFLAHIRDCFNNKRIPNMSHF